MAPSSAWVVLGLVGITATLISSDDALRAAAYYSVAFGAAAAVLVGVVRLGRLPRPPWLLLAAGITSLALGDVTWDALAVMGSVPEPSLADIFYVAGSAAIIVGIALLMLRGLPPLAALLDTLVIGLALAIVLWTLAVEPRLHEGAASLPVLATVAAYPALDVAMLSIVCVALLAGRTLDWTAVLLIAGAVATLAADLAYLAVDDSGEVTVLLDSGWLLAYVLWAAAALVPEGPHASSIARFRPRPAWPALRPLILVGAAAVPLLMALMDQAWRGEHESLATAVASVSVSVIVILRLELLIREQGRLLDDRRHLHLTLQRQATEDPLTELPNRRGLSERLAMALSSEAGRPALMVLDLDDFKAVNDALGHPTGDLLLREVSQRLRSAVRNTDMVARLGGDEFAVVLSPCHSMEIAATMADRLLRSLDEPFLADWGGIAVSGSIGIALDRTGQASVEDLFRDADIALYRAKAEGKDRWSLLDPEASAAALRTLAISSDLARAVKDGELELHFQPVVSLTSGRIESLEALLRWNHPRLGRLMPAEFLATAQRSIQMSEIGRWVLEEAFAAAASWRHQGFPGLGVRVNVAASQLADESFPELVLRAAERAGLEPRLVTLEILESALDVTAELHGRLLRLREAGVELAIDDFGMGYSTLSRVAQIPARELKLDRSLVATPDDDRMLRAIVRLGQTLGVRMVAEGIESDLELELVRALGCDAAQGYWIAEPCRTPEVHSLLRSWDQRHEPKHRPRRQRTAVRLPQPEPA